MPSVEVLAGVDSTHTPCPSCGAFLDLYMGYVGAVYRVMRCGWCGVMVVC